MLPLRRPWLCLVLACSLGNLASLTAVPGNDFVSLLSSSCGYSQTLQESCTLCMLEDQTSLSPTGVLGALRRGSVILLGSKELPERQKWLQQLHSTSS